MLSTYRHYSYLAAKPCFWPLIARLIYTTVPTISFHQRHRGPGRQQQHIRLARVANRPQIYSRSSLRYNYQYFFQAARRAGTIAVKFSILPGGAIIYGQWSPTQQNVSGVKIPYESNEDEYALSGSRNFPSLIPSRRNYHSDTDARHRHDNIKKVAADQNKDPVSKAKECHICGSPRSGAAAAAAAAATGPQQKPPLLTAPDQTKFLPGPSSVDSLYFYNQAYRRELLHEISGFLPRLRARLRRALKGSYQKRSWTIDDIFAMATWVIMSHAMLLLIGTTTTVSVVLWLLNRLQYQDWIAYKLSNWVSSALGVTVSFESAIVPAWSQGAIRLKNVIIHCGPEHGAMLDDGSQDSNFTTYSLQIDQMDVALSLWRWLDDRGLIRECSVRGVRGVVDRRQVWWDSDIEYIPSESRRLRMPGFFDLELLEIEDMLLTIHPWQNFRPITMSVYSASLPRFRDRWLLYDILNANSVVGMYDGSLFTIHRAHQQHTTTGKSLYSVANRHSVSAEDEQLTTTHIQVDNLNIDHINSGVEGPAGWITSGRLNVSALVAFPEDRLGTDPARVIKRIVDNINDSIDVVILPSVPDWSNPELSPNPLVRSLYHLDMLDSPLAKEMHDRLKRRAEREAQRRLDKQRQRTASWSQPLDPTPDHQIGGGRNAAQPTDTSSNDTPTVISDDPTAVHVDLQVEFNNIRASVPLATTPQLGHPLLSSVLVRPIVAYMNAHRMSLPMRCQLRLHTADFDGAWSFWDSGADTLIVQGIGAAFTQLAQNERERSRRLKLVGWWSVGAIARQLVRLFEFIHSQRSFFYYMGTASETDRI